MRERPVCHDRDLRAARNEVAGGCLAHLPGADDQDAVAVEVAEDLLRERCGSGGHRRGALADRRLDPDAPPGVQRLAEEPVEERAGRAGLEGRANLAEDLPLAGHERVEPGGDAEEVERGCLVVQPVERCGEVGRPIACDLAQRLDRERLVLLVADEVELGAIARREHDRLSFEPPSQLTARVEVERDALAQLDRSAVVRDTCERQLHGARLNLRNGSGEGQRRRARSRRGSGVRRGVLANPRAAAPAAPRTSPRPQA